MEGLRNTIGYADLHMIIEKQLLQEVNTNCGIKVARMKNKGGAVVVASPDTVKVEPHRQKLVFSRRQDCHLRGAEDRSFCCGCESADDDAKFQNSCQGDTMRTDQYLS